MEARCKQICSCLSDSKDPEDIKRQAYRVVECSFYTKKTAPSFLNHCFQQKACQAAEGQMDNWRKKCEAECAGTMPAAKTKVERCCHASFPISSYKTFHCDSKGDACSVRNDLNGDASCHKSAGKDAVAPTSGLRASRIDSGSNGFASASVGVAGSRVENRDDKGKNDWKELSRVALSEDVEKRMILKEWAGCASEEAKAIKCPVRKVRNCEGKCEDEIIQPSEKHLRCKELCPQDILPLKKRQVYAKCGGMVPGYGGHVPGYTICTLGNSFGFETERCLKRVVSDERLTSIVRKCKLADAKIVFVIGGPGSGKGTQCDMLKETFNLTHLSSGDLLRAEVESGSDFGKSLLATMERGELVSLETVLDILEAAMMEALKTGSKGFLIDGYPREVKQGITFARKIRDCDVVLFFDAKDDTMTDRLLKRAVTSGRADDNYATIRLRLKTFHDQTRPVVNFYKQRGKLIHVDAERNPKEIFEEVVKRMAHYGF